MYLLSLTFLFFTQHEITAATRLLRFIQSAGAITSERRSGLVRSALVTPFRGVVSSWSDSVVDAAAAAAATDAHSCVFTDVCMDAVCLTSGAIVNTGGRHMLTRW